MNDERNPDAAPTPDTAGGELALLLATPPHSRSFVEGGQWIAEGWSLFRQQPLQLVVMSIFYVLISMVAGMVLGGVPLLGYLASMALNTVLIGGFVLAMDRAWRGEPITLEQLFSGFKHPAALRLAVLGVVMGALYIAVFITAALLAGVTELWPLLTGDADYLAQLGSGNSAILQMFAMLGLYILLLIVPVTMAIWFASALVIFHGLSPLDALAYSFRACLRNILPLTLYSLIFTVLSCLSIFTLFLAWIVLFPLLMTSWYISYRRTCTDLVPATVA